jgi:hypothetical protein
LVNRVLAIVPIAPARQPERFTALQDTSYRTVVKDVKGLGARAKVVKTHANDTALVVATPTDGNCLITSLLRGLHGGQPLSLQQEHVGMLELRSILSDHIKDHNWPHKDVASPQTIEQCVDDVATEGKWCGELAMVAFATLTGSEIKLWRYPADNKESTVIEPLMVSSINEGDDRTMVYLLQTRAPRNGRPEFASHWESIIMKPSVIPPHMIEYGPATRHDDGSESFAWVVDPSRTPQLRISPWTTVTIKGRGSKKSQDRVVCQIKRRGPKGTTHVVVLGTGTRGKDTIITKPLTDVARVAEKQSEEEIKATQSTFNTIIAAKEEEAKAAVAHPVASSTKTWKGGKGSRASTRKRKTGSNKANNTPNSSDDHKSSGDDKNNDDEDDVQPKKKKMTTSGRKKKTQSRNDTPSSSPAPAAAATPTPPSSNSSNNNQHLTPKSARILKLEQDMVELKSTMILTMEAAKASAASATKAASHDNCKHIPASISQHNIQHAFQSYLPSSTPLSMQQQPPTFSQTVSVDPRVLDILQEAMFTARFRR